MTTDLQTPISRAADLVADILDILESVEVPRVLSIDDPEPPQGSIVLLEGSTGTAYQRHSDGRYAGTARGRAETKSHRDLFFLADGTPRIQAPVLVYEAPER